MHWDYVLLIALASALGGFVIGYLIRWGSEAIGRAAETAFRESPLVEVTDLDNQRVAKRRTMRD